MPEAVPSAATGRPARTAEPRRDTTAADAGSLEHLDRQSVPGGIRPFLEPDLPPAEDDE